MAEKVLYFPRVQLGEVPVWSLVAAKPGDKGDGVLQLQKALKSWGFDPTELDGVYGQHTVAAVSALQRKLGLDATGIFTAISLKAVTTDLASPTSIIRQTQKDMGLTHAAPPGVTTSSSPPLKITPSKLAQLAKSPVVWIGAAAIVMGAIILMRGRRAAVAAYEPPDDIDEDFVPARERRAIGESVVRRKRSKRSGGRTAQQSKFKGCAATCKGSSDNRGCMSGCLKS